jgi:hypothetical protein
VIGNQQPVNPSIHQNWLDVASLAEVEITSEDALHPIESAFVPDGISGWRAAMPGNQTIRLIFDAAQNIRQIFLCFVEPEIQRTQEYELRWSADRGKSFQEIVRQQWNFNPVGATSETENHHVQLNGVTILELNIIPDISGGNALATLAKFRIS